MGEQGRWDSSPKGLLGLGRVGRCVTPTDGTAGHVGKDPQGGGGVTRVLLILPRLLPHRGTGILGSQAGWVLWEREGRMQSGESQTTHTSSPCGPAGLLWHRARHLPQCVLPLEHPLLWGCSLCPQGQVCPNACTGEGVSELLQVLWPQPRHEP